MQEEDETPPATWHSPDPSSPSRNQTTHVTVAKADSPLPDALALMPLAQAAASEGGGNCSNDRASGGGGGRDDWSEAATAVLIDAWQERSLVPSRGYLKLKDWKEVAEIVSKEGLGKSPKTGIQCKNRIDTVKKKYKQEKAKIAACGGTSKWVFFEKLDRLIGASVNFPTTAGAGGGEGSSQKVPIGVVRRCSESTRWQFRKRSASETEAESESEPEPSAESGDSHPPVKRVKADKTGSRGGTELGELSRAILRFTEAYEKAETGKLKQMVEMEKERMKFLKELELQRMQLLRTHFEISQLKQDESTKENRQ